MPTNASCPNPSCGTQIAIPDLIAGRILKCPRCDTTFDPNPPPPSRPSPRTPSPPESSDAATVVFGVIVVVLLVAVAVGIIFFAVSFSQPDKSPATPLAAEKNPLAQKKEKPEKQPAPKKAKPEKKTPVPQPVGNEPIQPFPNIRAMTFKSPTGPASLTVDVKFGKPNLKKEKEGFVSIELKDSSGKLGVFVLRSSAVGNRAYHAIFDEKTRWEVVVRKIDADYFLLEFRSR